MGLSTNARDFEIRPARVEDVDAVLRLNTSWEHVTSPLDRAALLRLHEHAAYHRVAEGADGVAAFLIAFREGADYDSPNYRWFAAAYERFLYVDRLVVSQDRHRSGLGSALYDDVIAFARAENVPRVVCELDIEPLNATSAAFHDRYRFREVGTQSVAGGTKRVSLRELTLG